MAHGLDVFGCVKGSQFVFAGRTWGYNADVWRVKGAVRLEHIPGIPQPFRAERMAGRMTAGPQRFTADEGGTGHH
jgi:hypothetical protein